MPTSRETALLTVAAIRPGLENDEYLFYERQSIFTLAGKALSDKKTASQHTSMLATSLENKGPVKVTFDTKRGVVLAIAEPKPAERETFSANAAVLDKPAKISPIEVRKIDPTKFNIVGPYLKWAPFKLCEKIVPSYSKAQEIFEFCAALSCHLPGPKAVTPCIPFQYVIDGCYARAHQMRRIITDRFGYCCEKVFSFATAGNDRLAVRANKWGGCCVTWWYHVAPLIRVNTKLSIGADPISLTTAMVIDPGMFDAPVTLSTWLQAQETTSCTPSAHVTSYSIQPGTAYMPSGPNAFSTDPNYTQTEATLNSYSSLKTC